MDFLLDFQQILVLMCHYWRSSKHSLFATKIVLQLGKGAFFNGNSRSAIICTGIVQKSLIVVG